MVEIMNKALNFFNIECMWIMHFVNYVKTKMHLIVFKNEKQQRKYINLKGSKLEKKNSVL